MTPQSAVQRYIDDDEVVQVAQDLVRIPSITHIEGRGVATYMENWFRDLKLPMRLYDAGGDRVNFFVDYGATDGPGRYIFNGHQDTKPTGTMTVDPFAAEIRDGRMYGRGACDMKSGLAGVLCAFKALIRAGVKPAGGITFYSDIEEEYGGPAGMTLMLEEGRLEGYEALISCEPTGMELQIGNNGGMATAYEASGRTAHSGLAHLGVNAVVHMARFITEYLELPYLKVENPLFGKSTVNFEKIDGGNYLSAVPDWCRVCLDTRFIPDTPPEMVRAQIADLIDRLHREEGITIREVPQPLDWRPPGGKFVAAAFIPPEHPFVRRVATAYHNALGTEPVLSGCPGATIAGLMIRRGTPAVIIGPGRIEQAHTDDEWITVADIPRGARVYAELMAGM